MALQVRPTGPAEIPGSENTRALMARPQGLTAYIPDMPQARAEDIERALTIGDLSKMPPDVRIRYYLSACESAGLNALTRPFTPMKTQSGEVVLYANAQAAEQLRKIHRLSIRVLSRVTEEGLYTVTVQGRMPDGREDEAQGIVEVAKLQGVALANARLKCETKAKRRLTMAMIGLGFALTDEAEGSPIRLNTQTGDLDGGPVPLPQIETVSLEQHIEELTDKPVPTASMAGAHAADYVPQIEALLVTQGGNIPAFWGWAERQKKKAQALFTAVDYADLLQRAQAQVTKRRAQDAPTDKPTTADHAPGVAGAPTEPSALSEGTTGDPDAKNTVSPSTTPGAWREMLAGLVTDLQDSTLAQEAGSILEDADATDETGNAMVSRVLDALDGQADDATLPF